MKPTTPYCSCFTLLFGCSLGDVPGHNHIIKHKYGYEVDMQSLATLASLKDMIFASRRSIVLLARCLAGFIHHHIWDGDSWTYICWHINPLFKLTSNNTWTAEVCRSHGFTLARSRGMWFYACWAPPSLRKTSLELREMIWSRGTWGREEGASLKDRAAPRWLGA